MMMSKEQRAKAFKAGKCQRCERKVGKGNLLTVRYTDKDRTALVVEPAAADSRNSFCEDCAESRRKTKQRSIEARAAAATNGAPKPKAAKPKASAKPKPKRQRAKAKVAA